MEKNSQEAEMPEEPVFAERLSGHLPDFEEEEIRKKQKCELKEREAMTLTLQEKEDEITRLKLALSKMGEKDEEISRLKAALSKKDMDSFDDMAKKDMDITSISEQGSYEI